MTKPKRSSVANERLHQFSDSIGNFLVDLFHYLALFAIGGAIVWSAASTFIQMGSVGHASIEDILLLFIYLELGAMWAYTSKRTICQFAFWFILPSPP